jgi:hypothetical protein
MLRPALTLLVLYRVVVVRSNRFAHVSELLLPKLDQTGRTQRSHWVPVRERFSGGRPGAQMS